MKIFRIISLFIFVSPLLFGQQRIYAINPTHHTAEIQQVEAHADEAHYPPSRGWLNSIHSEAESSLLSFQKLSELHSLNELDEDEKHSARSLSTETNREECYLARSNYLFVGYSVREILFPFHAFL